MYDQQPGHNRSSGKIIIGLALLFMGLIAFGIWFAMPPAEPTYQGKTLTYWLTNAEAQISVRTVGGWAEGLKNPRVVESREAVRHMGTNAIPPLLRMLRAKDSSAKIAMTELMMRQDKFNVPFKSVEQDKPLVQLGFLFLGDLATNAVPQLIAICKNTNDDISSFWAEMVLAQLYPAPCVARAEWVPKDERVEWYQRAAAIQLEVEAPSNAVLAYSEAIKLAPTNESNYSLRGQVKIELKDYKGAIQDENKALELEPKDEQALNARGMCRFAAKDFKGANEDFTKAIDLGYTDAMAYDFRGLARANLHKMDEALDDFEKALRINPKDAAAYRNRAMVESAQRELESALEDISEAIRLEPRDPMEFATRGRIRVALKEYELGRQDLDKAIEMSPREATFYASRALSAVCMNDFESAGQDLEKSFELKPDNSTAFSVRGFLRLKQGKDEESVADLKQAVEFATLKPEVKGLLGSIQYKAHDWPSALENCRNALDLGSLTHTGDCYGTIWLIRAQTGETDGAIEELKSYLKAVPRSKTNDWSTVMAQYLTGSVTENNFFKLATSSAKRPSAVKGQVCDSFYLAGMKHKLAGDKPGAKALFQKCLETKDDNSFAYYNARDEIKAMK